MIKVQPNRTVSAQLIFGPAPAKKTPSKSSNAWMWYVGGSVAAVAVGTLTYFLVTRDNSSPNHQTQLCFDGDCP